MKLRIPKLLRRKRLLAATARRAAGASAELGYEELEPNMKLSRALLIVLLLHVVAVSGIIAFNAIKTRQSSFAPAPLATNTETNPAARSVAPAINADAPKPGAAVGPHNDAKTSRSLSKPIAKAEHPKSSEDDK